MSGGRRTPPGGTVSWQNLWSDAPAGAGRLLLPALRAGEVLFRLGVAARERRLRAGATLRAAVPVVSVGGLEVGGVGKTPLVLELYRLALRAGLCPAVLSRGYGGSGGPVPARVPRSGEVRVFGDEPLWLAERVSEWGGAGVWVSPDRTASAHAAQAEGATLAILDDGFQHRRLHRDGDIVSLAGRRPLANRRLLPAGPLREPPSALRRAGRIVLSGIEPEQAPAARAQIVPYLAPRTPVYSWRGRPSLRPLTGSPPVAGEKVRLLAGIAHPERLFDALARLGFSEVEARIFPDHHRFTREDLGDWKRDRRAGPDVEGAIAAAPAVITTEKDWMRLRTLLSPEPGAGVPRLSLLGQDLEWNEENAEGEWSAWLAAVAAAFAR